MPDAISIGPVAVPPVVVSGLIAAIAVVLVLRLPRSGDADAREWVRDRITTAALVGFVLWKLTPIIPYFSEIVADPMLLVRLPGGRLGVFVGALGATATLVPGVFNENGRRRPVAIAVSTATVVYLFAGAILGAAFDVAPAPDRYPVEVEVLDAPTRPLHEGEQVTVLGFWATWCGPCRAELPVKRRFHDEYGDRATYLAVNLLPTEAGVSSVRAYVATHELPYPVVLDRDGSLADAFGIRGTPTTVVIGRDGSVVDRWLGPSSLDRIVRAIEKAER